MNKESNPEMPLEDDLNPQVTFEAKDIRSRQVIGWGIALIVTLLASQCLVWLTFRSMQTGVAKSEPAVSPLRVGMPPQLPPEPRLQGAPGHPMTGPQDLQTSIRDANGQLNSYGWVDQSSGIAHIPIQQAMDSIVQSGLPSVPPVPVAGSKGQQAAKLADQSGAKGATQ
jgi:hypothetical protein